MQRILIILLMLTNMASASAQQDETSADDATPERLEEIEQAIEARRRERAEYEAEATELDEETRRLQVQISDAATVLQTFERRALEIEGRLAKLSEDERVLSDKLDADKSALSDALSALQSIERNRPPAIAVTPDDAATAARAAMLLSTASDELSARAQQAIANLDRLAATRQSIADEQAKLRETEADISVRRSVLEDLLVERNVRRDLVLDASADLEVEIAALAEEASTLRTLIEKLQSLANRIQPRLKPSPNAPGDAAPARRAPTRFAPGSLFSDALGHLPPPVAGAISRRFDQPLAGGQRSEGVSFQTRAGAVASAPFDSRVIFARAKKPLGNVLILDVGDGYHIVMVGLERFFCVEGQTVLAGEPLGAVIDAGQTGPSPELYMEIRKDRAPIDPAPWLTAFGADRAPS